MTPNSPLAERSAPCPNACHGSLFFALALLTTQRQRHAPTDEQEDSQESFFCAAQAGSHSVFFIVSAVVVPLGKNAMRRARRNLVWNGHTAPGPVRSPCQSANRRSSRGSPPSRTTPLSSSSRQQPPVHPCSPPRALPRGSLLCFGAPPLLFILLEKRDFLRQARSAPHTRRAFTSLVGYL